MITARQRSTLWFTNGAVVALMLAVVFVGVRVTAAPSAQKSSFVPIVPCRLFDTRPAPDNVGTRSTPLPTKQPVELQVTGTNGECTIPTDATAVAMNVTIANPTARSFLQLFPADESQPERGSNLNWVAGQTPTPNKVDVKLSATGSVNIYNHAGTVDALADVVGYYAPADGSATSPSPVLVGSTSDDSVELSDDGTAFETAAVTVVAPVAGSVLVSSSVIGSDQAPGGKIFCSISTGMSIEAPLQGWESAGPNGSIGQMAGTRVVPVAAGSHTFRLMCQSQTSDDGLPATANLPSLSALFVAD